MARFGATAVAILAALLMAPAGLAATVGINGSTLTFVAASGETNQASVYKPDPGTSFTISDTGAALAAGPGCSTVDASTVTCPTSGIEGVVFELGDQDDSFQGQAVVPLTVSAGPGSDDVIGSFWADMLSGGDGPDRLEGLSGNDVLHGDGGDDALDGDFNADVLDGGSGDDSLTGGPGGDAGDVLHGGDGEDTADYSAASADAVTLTLDGAANDGSPGEADNVGPAGDVENLSGTNLQTIFGDLLVGDAQDNVLIGGLGDDRLEGGGGNDLLLEPRDRGWDADHYLGGPGDDTVDYSARLASVRVDLDGVADDGEEYGGERDNVETDVETVRGGSAADVLIGNAAPNLLVAGPGNDVVTGGLGDDDLVGGTGEDTLTEGGGGELILTATSLDGLGADALDGFERATLSGGSDDDLIDSTEFPFPVTLHGGGGSDILISGSGADALHGGSGDDFLDGRLGADELRGDEGVDTVDYSNRNTPLFVTLDTQVGNDGAAGEGDTVAVSNEILIGGNGADYLAGSFLGDVLIGGPGADHLHGFLGNDILDGGVGADLLDGGRDYDLADYIERTAGVTVDLDGVPADDGEPGEGDTLLTIEDIRGGAGDDTLIGNDEENFLFGHGGNDMVDGGPSSDFLSGGSGDDRLSSRDGTLDEGDCGDGGADSAVADWLDEIGACEQVSRPAPTVSTGATSEIGSTSARLTGTVNPNGNASQLHWEIGATTAYGTASPTKVVGGSETATVSEVITGLASATTYHYRLVATNGAGTTYGDDRTFTTASSSAPLVRPPPPHSARCVVPNLLRKRLAAARRSITKARCKVGKITRQHSRIVGKGRVLAQKPRAGRRVPRGTKVALIVSRGRRR